MKVSLRLLPVILAGFLLLSCALAGCVTSQKTPVASDLPAAPAQIATNTPAAVQQVACPGGFADCNGACRDITSDVLNCGGCGYACPESSICKDSQCLCKEGYAACNGKCKDVMSDTASCGACKNQCSAGEKCVSGICTKPTTSGQRPVGATCPDGLSVCGEWCADLNSDSSNCAMCGNVCSGGLVCNKGVCTLPAGKCNDGQTACSGYCYDLKTSTENCGSCGNACITGQSCSAGQCVSSGTSSGLQMQDCTGGKTRCSSGCKDLATDSSNCGTCGNQCSVGQTCGSGTCVAALQKYCSGDVCNGKCTDLQTDTANCGVCGNQCSSGQSCKNGKCILEAQVVRVQTLCKAGSC